MEVNGLKLPASLVRLIRDGKAPGQNLVEWRLKKKRDAYGRPWDGRIFRFYEDEQTMAQRTAELPEFFGFETPEERHGMIVIAHQPHSDAAPEEVRALMQADGV
jgi:hypothetical protein